MKREVIKNAHVTIMSDNDNANLSPGILFPSDVMVKSHSDIFIMLKNGKGLYRKHNPLLYRGRFFNARQRKDGKIALHAIITPDTDIMETFKIAPQELNEFFCKLIALL